MNLIADWIEEKIQAAIANGEFENLPGAGKPLDLDDDTFVPKEMRVAYRVLKNSGFLPAELNLYQELQELRKQISENKELKYEEFQKLKMRLVQKESEFNMSIERLQRREPK